MSGWKKLASAAAASGGEATNVEDVFATHVYEGNSSFQKISNGVKLGDGDTSAVEFTEAGTYSWTCPAGVTSVDVVCVGGGGAYSGGGGGGGGLGYKNNISVTAGTTYTVRVGEGGKADYSNTQPTALDSYFISTSTVKGGGGNYSSGGNYTGDGGGNGGAGGNNRAGGGAGGYSGNGGDCASNYGNGSAGSGGGGGSDGFDGGRANGNSAPNGGLYGGGGGTAYIGGVKTSGDGANGAVRIVYRSSSNFPTTDVGFTADGEGHGGLVWTKQRNQYKQHVLVDSERNSGGTAYYLSTDNTNAQQAEGWSWSFNGDGYSMDSTSSEINDTSNKQYCSWTFRKAPKFFDVVYSWTGDGTSSQTISHNLGSVPGAIFVKCTSVSDNWRVYHRSMGNTDMMALDSTGAAFSSINHWNNTSPTATEFTVGANANVSGRTYVAYLFAHNDGDGEFGPDGDADIIKCGTIASTSADIVDVDLGFEPQWIMIKKASATGNWQIFDNLRGMPWGSDDQILEANRSDAESNSNRIKANPDGFTASGFGTNTDYIFIAVRRGPMAIPTIPNEVFSISDRKNTTYNGPDPDFPSSHRVDFALYKDNIGTTGNWVASSRLQSGKRLMPNTDDTEASSGFYSFDYNKGWGNSGNGADANDISWMWKRAPNYFDVVCYQGDGTANQTFNHNLQATPEMVWIKNRSRTQDWFVWVDDDITTNEGRLNSSSDFGYNVIGTVTDTTVQTLYTNQFATNYSGDDYVAYLFTTLDGVSKVGSYTGNGSNQNIDCGFSNGARFVLVKVYDGSSNWQLAGAYGIGITTGSDSLLRLDLNNALTTFDFIDPYSAGFNVTGGQLNTSGTNYMFYAIA